MVQNVIYLLEKFGFVIISGCLGGACRSVSYYTRQRNRSALQCSARDKGVLTLSDHAADIFLYNVNQHFAFLFSGKMLCLKRVDFIDSG